MLQYFRIGLLSVAMFLLYAGAALAQTTTVVVPWGDWVYAALPLVVFVILLALLVGVAFVLPKLPPWVQSAAKLAITKENIAYAAQAINAAVMAVAGAAKGKRLELNVGNPLVAKAAQEFVNTVPKAVVDRLGGLEGVKKFIISQLEDHNVILPDDATTADILNSPSVRAVVNPNP